MTLKSKIVIKSREHAGTEGRVVALLAIEPTPLYVIELALSGLSLTVPQSDLKRAA